MNDKKENPRPVEAGVSSRYLQDIIDFHDNREVTSDNYLMAKELQKLRSTSSPVLPDSDGVDVEEVVNDIMLKVGRYHMGGADFDVTVTKCKSIIKKAIDGKR